MNIAIFSMEFPPYVHGGLGRYIECYTRYLLENNHNLWVFTYNSGELAREEIRCHLTIYRPLKKWVIDVAEKVSRYRYLLFFMRFLKLFFYNIDSYRIIRKLHRNIRFDFIAIHDWMSCPAGILCGLTLKIPIVFHVHNTEKTMTPWGKRMDPLRYIAVTERLLAGMARAIIVPSDKMYDLAVNHGWKSGKIVVIPHGYSKVAENDLDMESSSQARSLVRSRLNFGANDKVILFVGRLVHAKGIYQLIHAMKIVAAAIPQVKLIIAGKGENREVESLIRQLDLTGTIYAYYRFLSFEEVSQHYRAADLCVFPSLYEPFGLVALEAMSHGKPVILGTGFPEIFGNHPDNPTAVFVDGNRPGMIAAEIIGLLRDVERSARMGEAAKIYVRNHFDWDKTFEETVRVYQQVVNG